MTALIALIGVIMNSLGLLYFGVLRTSRIESKVEILWEFLIRRGIVEAVEKGVMRHNSPLIVPASIKERYKPLIDIVQVYYNRDGSRLSDTDLVMEIEKHFWPQIKEMCLKEGIHDGACLAIMLHVIRPNAKVFKEWEPIEWSNGKGA